VRAGYQHLAGVDYVLVPIQRRTGLAPLGHAWQRGDRLADQLTQQSGRGSWPTWSETDPNISWHTSRAVFALVIVLLKDRRSRTGDHAVNTRPPPPRAGGRRPPRLSSQVLFL